jgi:predicted SAM-dependent methyltransferase
MRKKLLHVGCGDDDLSRAPEAFSPGEWTQIRLDIDKRHNPDIIGSMTDMSAVETGSMDAVYSSHNIEHLFAHEVPVALKEFLRVLKPDGFAVVTCPDMKAIAETIVAGQFTEPVYQSEAGPVTPLDMIYGYRPMLRQGQHYMAHKSGFVLRSLAQALLDCGFGSVHGRRRPENFAIWVVGTKPQHDDIRVEALGKRYFI